MPLPSFPTNEMARLQALRKAEILDTPLEPQYDNIVQLAAFVTKAPVAVISLADEDRRPGKRSGIAIRSPSLSICVPTPVPTMDVRLKHCRQWEGMSCSAPSLLMNRGSRTDPRP